MATITTDTFLDGGTARTAGEAWTCNGGKLTVRTDTRWHADAPASMTGSLSSQTISPVLGGGILLDGRNVRWMPYDTGTGNVPAIGTTVAQGGVSGYLLGVWASLTSAPTAVGAAMPASGFLKFREVTTGPFAAGALTGIGASATGPDVAGWIEVVMDQAATITVPRKGTGHVVRGDWFYLDDTAGTVGQVLQVPTNGGGADTYGPGVWIETAPTSGVYEYWPELASASANGWTVSSLGAPEGGTDVRQKFVKGLGSGQLQIGETATQASTYTGISQVGTYTWANNLATVTFTSHGYSVGQTVYLDFTTGGATASSGVYTVESVPSTSTFTVVVAGGGTGGAATIYGRATVTFTAHGMSVGQTVYLDATTGSLTDGVYEVLAVTDANNYVILAPANVGTGDATARFTLGHVPPSGCKTRIPNVFMRQCATGTRAVNARPNATIANRPEFSTSGAGSIDHEYAYTDWYYNLSQPYQVRLVHAGIYDAIIISECATALDISDGGNSLNQALGVASFTLTSCFAGGTIQNWTCFRANAANNGHSFVMTLCSGQSLTNVQSGVITTPRASGQAFSISQSKDLTFTGCRSISGTFNMVTCSDVIVSDYDHVDRFIGYTNTVSGIYTMTVNTKCADIIVDGVTEGFGGTIPRVHSYAGLFNCTSSDRVTFRNAGTRAAPLGGANNTNDRNLVYLSGGNNSGIRLQRIYSSSTRTGGWTDLNSDKDVTYESVSSNRLSTRLSYTQLVASLNAKVRGISAPLLTTAANASVYGTHWWDAFTLWYRMSGTYTWAADSLAVSFTSHGVQVGDKVYLLATSGGATVDGVYTVATVTSTSAFTVRLAGSGASGNVLAWRNLTTVPADVEVNGGRLHLPMNEPTAETSGYVTITGNAQFTSAPGLTLPTSGDEVVVESQHTIIGHTAFPNVPVIVTGTPVAQSSSYTWAANVVTVTFTSHGLAVGDQVFLDRSTGTLPDGLYTIAGITSANVYTISLTGSGTSGNAIAYRLLRFRYQINTGSGYGAWRNLDLYKVGATVTAASSTITVADTTGIAVGDYVYGNGVGENAKVQSIDSATDITVTVANWGTYSNQLLRFNYLPNETISPTTGFTIKASITADTPGTTMVVTYLTVPTTTTAAAQDNLYPLSTNTLTLTGLKNPTEVRVFNAGTTTEIGGQETITSGTFSTEIDAGTYSSVDISILALGYQNTRLLGVSMAGGDVSIPVQQNIDRQYQNT